MPAPARDPRESSPANLKALTDYFNTPGVLIALHAKTKHPIKSGWTKQLATDYPSLKDSFTRHPDAMLGVTTGKASGIWVLDIDGPAGKAWLANYIAQHGPLPATPQFKTPKGYRYVFKWQPGMWIKTTAGQIAPGVDQRGHRPDGQATGETAIPPSVNLDGGKYEWVGDLRIADAVPAPLPLLFLAAFNARERNALAAIGICGPEDLDGMAPEQWQATALTQISRRHVATERKKRQPAGVELHPSAYPLSARERSRITKYVETAVERECATLQATGPGSQDTVLNNTGMRINGLLAGAALYGLDTTALAADAHEKYCDACVGMQTGRIGEPWTRDDAEKKWDRTSAAATPATDLAGCLEGDPAAGVVPIEGAEAPQLSTPAPITATAFEWVESSTIPPREWLYGGHYIRQFVSVTVAPGALGKTSNAMVEALAIVTGKPLLGVKVPKPCKVWYWNGEDPFEELQRRIMAACKHHRLTRADIEGRLFVDSGRKQPIIIAREDRTGLVIAEPVVEQVKATIRANQIDVLIIDPFVKSHAVSENDNNKMHAVASQWAGIADECNISIELVHHARKLNGNELTVEDARGGGALIDAARSGRTLNRMTAEEGEKAGVDNHRLYFRLGDGKPNMQPPADKATWRHLASVHLGNATMDNDGDNVGVVTAWAWPAQLEGLPGDAEERVVNAMAGVAGRASERAEGWVGCTVATALGLDLDDARHRTQVRTLVEEFLKRGIFEKFDGRDERREIRPFIRLRQAAALSDI